MKSSRTILLPVIILILGSLACSSISNFMATPTPVPTFTPVPSPTPIPSDAFFEEADFERSSCFTTDSDSDVERFVENGEFHMKINTPNLIAWTVCTELDLPSDFTLEVDVTHEEGTDNNLFGVLFRYDLSDDDFYNFAIGADGFYVMTLDGYSRTDVTYLVEWDESPVISQGKTTNHLKLVVNGDHIEYFINDQRIGEVSNSELSGGAVGFVVGTFDDGGVHVSFDNLKVTE